MKCFQVFQTRQAKYKLLGMPNSWYGSMTIQNSQMQKHQEKERTKKRKRKRREIKQSKQFLLRLTEQGILRQNK